MSDDISVEDDLHVFLRIGQRVLAGSEGQKEGAIEEEEEDGEDVTYPAMGLSLTFDHRALDFGDAAPFMRKLDEIFANPDTLETL